MQRRIGDQHDRFFKDLITHREFSQDFADYVQTQYPCEARTILSATGGSTLLARQQQLADQFIKTHVQQLANSFASAGTSLQQETSSPMLHDREKYLIHSYQYHRQVTSSGSNKIFNSKHCFRHKKNYNRQLIINR